MIPLNQTIIRAKSGKEALQAILNNDFALILMDVQMPEINGFETAELIRGRFKSRLIPIIFVTAYRLDAEYIFLGYTTGAVDYIFKPIVPEILLAKVNVFIELYQQNAKLKTQAESLKEINHTLEIEIKSQGTKNKVNVKINDLPNTLADDNLMFQVWINLISNAFKYSSKKTTSNIEIGAYPLNDSIVYYIQDNGVGFDMADSDRLFTVFQRLHESEEFEGTGAGLAIVIVIIEKHLGSIWAESKVNEGARFMFSLPLINTKEA